MDSISNLIKELGHVPRELEDFELDQTQSNKLQFITIGQQMVKTKILGRGCWA